jgi:hypothetical protein
VVLPVPPIKRLNLQEVETDIQATRIHIETSRVRSRATEWVDPTHLAKAMLRRLRVESIGGKKLLTLQELKVFGSNYEIDEALLGAHGTVTFKWPAPIQTNPKPDAATMATTLKPLTWCAIDHRKLTAALGRL